MLTVKPTLRSKMEKIFIDGGISPHDSEAKVRAMRLANTINFTSVLNAGLFGVITWYINDQFMVYVCLFTALIFAFNFSLPLMGYSTFGRASSLVCGSFIVFWFACYFKGEAQLQLFFFTLTVAPFMYFDWEERSFYLLMLLPIALLFTGEVTDYSFFSSFNPQIYNLKVIRIFSIFATLNQIVLGFYYFLKQSVKFENESKENLQKLEVENKKQLQVQKMSSLGEMAGGIAHEINNPLAIIQMNNQILKSELEKKFSSTDSVLTHSIAIEKTVNRIAKIILALRSFSRNASNDPLQKTELKKIIDETLDLCFQRFVATGISLKVTTEEELFILCRPSEISQVLLNLLNNSYDAVSGTEGAWVEINSRIIANGQVEITIKDSGLGITTEIADKLFQPFFTTKEIGKGTGLGLSISLGIIKQHHGTLSYISDAKNTTFKILLPQVS